MVARYIRLEISRYIWKGERNRRGYVRGYFFSESYIAKKQKREINRTYSSKTETEKIKKEWERKIKLKRDGKKGVLLDKKLYQ